MTMSTVPPRRSSSPSFASRADDHHHHRRLLSTSESKTNDDAAAASSSSSSFFHETSGRSQRRRRRDKIRRRRQLLVQRKKKLRGSRSPGSAGRERDDEGEDEEEEDTRTVRDILFPAPQYDSPDELGGDTEKPKRPPRSFGDWVRVLSESWRVYRSTWNGFYTSRGFFVEEMKERTGEGDDDSKEGFQGAVVKKGEEIAENARRNVEFARVESENVRSQVLEATGISSKEDFRKYAGDAMRLASECVREFMAGYRKGRDDEVEKMLTKYFQDLEEQANRPKRRKRKRRVLQQF